MLGLSPRQLSQDHKSEEKLELYRPETWELAND